jgi:tetratricopeptide (TPR) repeat protein
LFVALSITLAAGKDKAKPAQQNGSGPTYHLNDAATRAGYEHFYNLEYDKAVKDFDRVVEEHPDDPFAINHLLSAELFGELYRIGALDTELYAKNSFLDKKKYPIDPKAQERIKQLTARSLAICEQRLKANPNDVDALYARGVVRGNRALYIGLIDKAWFAALRSAIGARRDHERVLELNPNYSDAKLIVGVHNYIMGSVPWTVKVAAAVLGLGGSKTRGIQYLYDAVNAKGEASVDAKVALALFLRREERYPEALTLVGSLVEAYPRNFLYGLEQALLFNAAGHAPEAIAAYRKLLAEGKEGKFPGARLEMATYGLGEALRGQKDYASAADAFESVKDYPKADPEQRQKADLAAGEMYDVLLKRDIALKKYQAVIAADGSSERADLARRHIKQPYRNQ